MDANVVWASGSGGTYLRTLDGGTHWRVVSVPDADGLDFRGVRAFDAHTTFLLSSGEGAKSRVYGTADGGVHWALLFTNPDPQGFFDAIACRTRRSCIVFGDPVAAVFGIFTTEDAGLHWTRRHAPNAMPDEGAFAASNSCLTLRGPRDVWFVTGGAGGARVFHSSDWGESWAAAAAPIRHDAASAGIFSIVFRDPLHGVAVGGDYKADRDRSENMAITSDSGRTWSAPIGGPAGYRSAVLWLPERKIWLATGSSGSDTSSDGLTWRSFDGGAYNALAASRGAVWAVRPGRPHCAPA